MCQYEGGRAAVGGARSRCFSPSTSERGPSVLRTTSQACEGTQDVLWFLDVLYGDVDLHGARGGLFHCYEPKRHNTRSKPKRRKNLHSARISMSSICMSNPKSITHQHMSRSASPQASESFELNKRSTFIEDFPICCILGLLEPSRESLRPASGHCFNGNGAMTEGHAQSHSNSRQTLV